MVFTKFQLPITFGSSHLFEFQLIDEIQKRLYSCGY